MTDVLDGFDLRYEELPKKTINKLTRKGGKDSKMSKEVKQPKQYAKTRGEHYKDIVIAVLVTGIIAFIAGASFQNKQQVINAVVPTAQAEPSK